MTNALDDFPVMPGIDSCAAYRLSYVKGGKVYVSRKPVHGALHGDCGRPLMFKGLSRF
jgi:hypothetical protein